MASTYRTRLEPGGYVRSGGRRREEADEVRIWRPRVEMHERGRARSIKYYEARTKKEEEKEEETMYLSSSVSSEHNGHAPAKTGQEAGLEALLLYEAVSLTIEREVCGREGSLA